MIRVRGPDGIVNNFPDGTPDAVIVRAMQAHYGTPVTAKGTAQSFLSGAAKGVAGLADMNPFGGNAMGDLGSQAAMWAGQKLGIVPPQVASRVNTTMHQALPQGASGQLQDSGLLHKPGNAVERFTDEAGQFAPNAVAPGGLEGNAFKIGARALLRTVTPVIAGQGAEAGAQALGAPPLVQKLAHVAGNAAGGFAAPVIEQVPDALKTAALGTPKTVTPEVAALAQAAMEKHKIPLQSWQIQAAGASGDRAAAVRGSNLIASDPRYAAAQLAQKKAFTKAVAGTFGADTDSLTTDQMAAARKSLSDQYEVLKAQTGVAADPQLLADLDKVTVQAKELGLSDNEQNALAAQVAKIKEVAAASPGGVISGAAYKSMTQSGSTLDKIMSSPHGSYGGLGGDIKTALNGAAARVNPDAAAAMKALDSQWAAMKTVEPLAAKSGAEGLISPPLLQARVNADYDNAAYGSAGDLGELGDIGQMFLKEPADSKTPARLLDKLKPAALAAGGADLVYALHDPAAAAGTAATGLAAYMAAKGVNAFRGIKNDNPVATGQLLANAPGATNAMTGRPPFSVTDLTLPAATAINQGDQQIAQ